MLKIRCSSLGKIMTNSRSKKDVLSQTAKTYLKEKIIEDKFGITKNFWSRYTEKGNQVEEQGIELCNKVLDTEFLYKNYEKFENDFILGTPDINTDNMLIDIKSSWNIYTFPFFEDKLPSKDYYYQLMGYMWLTGKKESLLCYCLLNTPVEIVEDEIRREHWKHHMIEEDVTIRKHVEDNHIFDNIDDTLKLKTFKVEYDEAVIQNIITRIQECRMYYDQLNKLLTVKEIEDAR
jgi:hypothetical protein